MFYLPVLVLESDVGGFRKILAEIMRGACLQGFAVLHHGFNAQGFDSAGEAFPWGFLAGNDRQRQRIFGTLLIDFQQRNSTVRKKIRGRISQRTTLAHWLMRTGRSR